MALEGVEGLRLEIDGPVVVATIDRGDENLVSMQMCGTLTDLLSDPPAGTRVLHVRAAPPVFCLGRDRCAGNEGGLRVEAETLVALNRALRDGRLLTVAEVGGDAAGYGVGLAALCDGSDPECSDPDGVERNFSAAGVLSARVFSATVVCRAFWCATAWTLRGAAVCGAGNWSTATVATFTTEGSSRSFT